MQNFHVSRSPWFVMDFLECTLVAHAKETGILSRINETEMTLGPAQKPKGSRNNGPCTLPKKWPGILECHVEPQFCILYVLLSSLHLSDWANQMQWSLFGLFFLKVMSSKLNSSHLPNQHGIFYTAKNDVLCYDFSHTILLAKYCGTCLIANCMNWGCYFVWVGCSLILAHNDDCL